MKHLGALEVLMARRLVGEIAADLDDATLQTMLRHVDWLIETNRSLNLSAIVDPTAAVRLHLIDSLLALPEVLKASDGLLIDLGTGGGFPGLELCLATKRCGLLVDSVRKKTSALHAFLVQEDLDSWISVSGSRAEELATEIGAVAPVVTARALAQLPSLVELAAPLLQDGGELIALKSRPDHEEVERGRAVAALCGMEEASVRHVVIPGGDERRTLIVYRRTGAARVTLPRRVGMAQKRPLA